MLYIQLFLKEEEEMSLTKVREEEREGQVNMKPMSSPCECRFFFPVFATFRVARPTLQTRKLWCRDQPSRAFSFDLLECREQKINK